jgi:hypothetical protein
MQNLITLIGLATLTNAASLVAQTEANVQSHALAHTEEGTSDCSEGDLALGSSFSILRNKLNPSCN